MRAEAPLSLIDCIILKKYPVYLLEFFGEGTREKSDVSQTQKKGKC